MSKRSKRGMNSAGLSLKKSRGGRTDHRLGRRSWLLSVADGGTDLGTTRTDSGVAGALDPGAPLGHQWHHDGWTFVPASASGFLHGCRRGWLPAGTFTQDHGQDPAHL